jgi:tyrosine-protein phosphatase SIW14
MSFGSPWLRSFLLTVVVFAGGASAGSNAKSPVEQTLTNERMHISGVRDAGRVNDFLYRGAQPNDKALEQLKALGITTIVDLRGERHGLIRTEHKHAESLGMDFLNLPGNGWSPPPDQQIAQFFSLMQETPRRRVFLHCWLGGDRSGVFIAAYRIAFYGWTPEQAIREMHVFHYNSFWHPAMTKYVREFPSRLASSPELASFRHVESSEKSGADEELGTTGSSN